MVVTKPSNTLFTGVVEVAPISIPGLSKVVFNFEFHCGPKPFTIFPLTGQISFPLYFLISVLIVLSLANCSASYFFFDSTILLRNASSALIWVVCFCISCLIDVCSFFKSDNNFS